MLYNSQMKTESQLDKLLFIIFITLIYLSVIQQFPIIQDYFYSEIRITLYIGLGILSIYSLKNLKTLIKISIVKMFLLAISYSMLLIILIIISNGYGTLNIFELLIPFGVFITSFNFKIGKKFLEYFLIKYIILVSILGLSLVFVYGDGFTITKIYFLNTKNQIGPMIGTSSIIILYWIFRKKSMNTHIPIIFKILILISLLLSLLLIRNRASLLAIGLVLLLLLLFQKKTINYKNILGFYIMLIFFLILIYLGYFEIIVEYIEKSLFLNYDLNNLNSISAGRTNVYFDSLNFIANNFFYGEIITGEYISAIPHNYLLNKWVNYGFVLSLPFTLLYIYLWYIAIRGIFFDNQTKFKLAVWVLLFSLIISMFEYTYPYGPGVSQMVLWMLLGQYFNNFIASDRKLQK